MICEKNVVCLWKLESTLWIAKIYSIESLSWNSTKGNLEEELPLNPKKGGEKGNAEKDSQRERECEKSREREI